MRRRWWAVAAAHTLVSCSCSSTANDIPPGDLEAFVQHLDATVPGLLEDHEVPGATVSLVHDGVVAWSGAYGVRETVSGEPLRPDDVFQVASVSKSVAAYAVMRLVQEGRLDLDVPIARYLTRWRLPDSEHDAEGVTARRLLSHTAGLSTDSYPGLPPGVPLPALEESLGGVPGIELVHQVEAPGAVYRYSGGGYTVLQLAVEEVTGKTFADSLAESVLTPLGISDSSYAQAPPAEAATPHGVDGDALPWYGFTELAAAGLASTAPDLARFLAAGIVDPDPINGLAPDRISDLLEPAAGTDGSFALGFFVRRAAGTTYVGHTGANAGWRTRILAIPGRGAGIVILTNSEAGEPVHTGIGCKWIAWMSETPTVEAAGP
ncbi:MAG: beta-lactamase family protein [Chloroflexi bacterium]|nr:beta-lactamase family protein [Chloroflexota bacterium]